MHVKQHLGVFVFIDGFGWELLRQHPFLNDLLAIKAPLQTVLGYSSTCIPTILTGKPPREHGHFTFFYYDPPHSPFGMCRFLGVLPSLIRGRAPLRRTLSSAIARTCGYTGYFQIYNMPFRYLPLFDYSEKRDIFQPGGINGGLPTIFDAFRSRHIPFHLSDWRASEEKNLETLHHAIEGGEIRVAYLALGALDALQHAYGTRSELVERKIEWYEESLRNLLKAAQRRYKYVDLFVFSDHGMTNVTETCDLMGKIERLGLTFGQDYAAVFDSTLARFWFLREGAREKITALLAKEVRGRILSNQDLVAYGCDFANQKYGELFFLMEPGALICPSFMGEKPVTGMHGYAPGEPNSLAMFASTSVPDPMPTRLQDLYGVMLKAATESVAARKAA